MGYGHKERTDAWNAAKKDAAGAQICSSDAGSVRTCDYCGFTYEDELLVKDERGFWACPTDLFAPEPEPPFIPEYDYNLGE